MFNDNADESRPRARVVKLGPPRVVPPSGLLYAAPRGETMSVFEQALPGQLAVVLQRLDAVEERLNDVEDMLWPFGK